MMLRVEGAERPRRWCLRIVLPSDESRTVIRQPPRLARPWGKHDGAYVVVVGLTHPAVELYEAGSANARAAKIFGKVEEQTIGVVPHPVDNRRKVTLGVEHSALRHAAISW